jgi:hypothetical protein
MICTCGQLIKKRTLVDGIKSLSGAITIYTYDGGQYLKACCFKLLIPSLYTFVSQDWFLVGAMVIVQNKLTSIPEPMLLYKVTPEIIKLILSYASRSTGEPLRVEEITTGISSLDEGYIKAINDLTKTYQTLIQLEKDMKGIKYNYSSISYDNECLAKQLKLFQDRVNNKQKELDEAQEEAELMNHSDRIDSHKILNKCAMCQTFPTIKEDLKLLKAESHEKISKIQYEHEIDKHKLIELQYNSEKMREEISRLKEENRLLRTTNNLDHNSICSLMEHC